MEDSEALRKRIRVDEKEGEEVVGHEEGPAAKRPCSTSSSSFHSILTLLESDEEDHSEDVSSLISYLQEELSSSSSTSCSSEAEPVPNPLPEPDSKAANPELAAEDFAPSSSAPAGDEVIRHLLEASDDELGIPAGEEERREEKSGETVEEEDEEARKGIGGISNYDMFWELEEEAANYYTLMQSELFMA